MNITCQTKRNETSNENQWRKSILAGRCRGKIIIHGNRKIKTNHQQNLLEGNGKLNKSC